MAEFRKSTAPPYESAPSLDTSIGELIKTDRSLTDLQVEEILHYQREKGIRFGEAAVALNLATDDDVLRALSKQFHYPYGSEPTDGSYSDELFIAKSPFSDNGEKFRDMRSQLLMGVMSPDLPKAALAVVSPRVGDGKSIIAANLALSLAQLGGRTLLIDADMRTPRQHKIFNFQTKIGLSNILAGRVGADAMVHISEFGGLYLLPAGPVPPNPVELIHRAAFGMLIQELILKFDQVVVDTPASIHGADAKVIAVKCGAATIISRRGRSKLNEVQALVSSLEQSGTRIAGVIVNQGAKG